MEFDIEERENPNTNEYSNEELDIAYSFAKRVHEEFGDAVKALVLFGSSARKKNVNKRSDIDILIVFDDVTMVLTNEVVTAYRVIIDKSVVETSTRLHVTSLKLTTFWEYIRAGDPVGMNILRDGVSLIDTGFFDPLRALLARGRIRPTPESVWTYFSKAPRNLFNSKWHVLQAVISLYWAVIDASHAALMKQGVIPPSPDHVAEILEKELVRKGLLERRYAEIMRRFYLLQKRISHRQVKEVSGRQWDLYVRDAEDFVHRIDVFLRGKKKRKVK